MGYALEAVIGPSRVLQTVVREQPAAVLVPLAQGITMIPMTGELFDAVTDGTADRHLGFRKLPGGFDRKLSAWSSVGPVGYIEAEYFGGLGNQRAALWVDQMLAVGPLSVEEGEPFAEAGSPISQLLRLLDVTRTGYYDEFDAVGLDRHRHTEEWLS